jgi:hopanoid biosynthesis associated RND transporter like protein HpnN
VAGGLVALVALTQLNQLTFDANPINLRDPDAESVITFKEMMRDKDATPMTLSILEPDLASAVSTAARLERISEVRRTLTLADLVPDRQQEKLEVLDELSVLLGPTLINQRPRGKPANPESTLVAVDRLAQSLVGLEHRVSMRSADAVRRLLDSVGAYRAHIESVGEDKKARLLEILESNLLDGLPPTLELLSAAIAAEEFDIDGLPDDLKAEWLTRDKRYRVAIYPRSDLATLESEARFVAAVLAEAPQATGVPVVEIKAGDAVVAAFRQALITAIVLVFVLLLLLNRNLRDPLLIITPVLIAALLTAAVTVLLDIPLNFANIIALPLLFGMGVDNGIHIVHRYRITHSGGASLMATSTAAAVFFGTLTTVFSFGNLALSPHVGMASMGQLLTIGMLLTMVTTLILLPAILAGRPGR